MPCYGAMLMFELHEHNETELVQLYGHSNLAWDQTHSIKIFYLNDTHLNGNIADTTYLLKIPACLNTEICTIRQFSTTIAEFIISPEEWIKECGLSGTVQGTNCKSISGKYIS